MHQGHDLYVLGIENNKGIFWKVMEIRKQYDLFMVRRWKKRRVTLKGKHGVTPGKKTHSERGFFSWWWREGQKRMFVARMERC